MELVALTHTETEQSLWKTLGEEDYTQPAILVLMAKLITADQLDVPEEVVMDATENGDLILSWDVPEGEVTLAVKRTYNLNVSVSEVPNLTQELQGQVDALVAAATL